MSLLLPFALGLGVGVYGYLTPGYINMSVLQLSTNRQKRLLWQAIGLISLVELPYCFVCMSGMQWLTQQDILMDIIHWLIVFILFLMSGLTLYEARKESKGQSLKEGEVDHVQYRRMIFFALFNPFQLSAWAIWGGYFMQKDWFDWSWWAISIFSFCAGVGVFMVLKLYAWVGQKLVRFFTEKKMMISYIVAGIILVLAILQLVENIKRIGSEG